MSVAGTFDVVSGAFNAAGPVTASGGKLAGASGSLVFDGVQDLVTGESTETVDGQNRVGAKSFSPLPVCEIAEIVTQDHDPPLARDGPDN